MVNGLVVLVCVFGVVLVLLWLSVWKSVSFKIGGVDKKLEEVKRVCWAMALSKKSRKSTGDSVSQKAHNVYYV